MSSHKSRYDRNFRPTLVALFGSAVILACSSVTGASSEPNTLSAAIDATRLSGPAPLAVMFDATGTTASSGMDTFREVEYAFDFGDDRGLTWEYSGKPRNTQTGGPLAAHVFDNPGQYTVRLRARTQNGVVSEASVTITVEDPAKTFPGENTICVSGAGAFAGCPSGSLRQAELPRTYAGKRVLLNRGEAFGIVSINRNSDGIIVGSYGTGPKPVVHKVIINSGRLNDRFTDDLTIMGLSIADGIEHSTSGSRYLIYGNELTRPGGDNKIDIGGALGYFAERNPRIPFYNPREIFIVDNVITGQVTKPHLNIGSAGAYFAIMGNDVGRAEEHTVRLFALYKGVIEHNSLRGIAHSSTPDQPSIRHALKLHSGGLLPYSDAWAETQGRWATRYVVIADNILGDIENNGSWTLAVGPQNRDISTVEGLEDVLIERNQFVRGPHTNTDAWVVGRRITARSNVRVDGRPINLSIGRPSVSLPPDWHGPYYEQ